MLQSVLLSIYWIHCIDKDKYPNALAGNSTAWPALYWHLSGSFSTAAVSYNGFITNTSMWMHIQCCHMTIWVVHTITDLTLRSILCRLCAMLVNILSSLSLYCYYMFRPNRRNAKSDIRSSTGCRNLISWF
jgi:hypothetical protein